MGSSELAAKVAFYGVIVCWWGFILAFWLRKRRGRVAKAKPDPVSYLGLLIQAVGFFIVWLLPLRRRNFAPLAGSEWLAWSVTVASVALAVGSIVLVIWAARSLGKQWSLGAQIVEGHELVENGPYRVVRNPIYSGMFGMLLATGLAMATWKALLAASILFVFGTVMRIRVEERLLRTTFGDRFDEYAHRVWALIPGIY